MKSLDRIRLIFCEALEKETEEKREAYLNEACRNDSSLRLEIDGLLKGHFRKDSFLKGPILDPLVSLENVSLSEAPGTVIDRYKLLEKIGEGGMAVVYMAEQKEPIRRKVALKIIKLGMDTKSVIARFEAERQALAMMDHPNIAKVLDAGATDTGRPYFVMELVKGASITDFCDINNLSTVERLELFICVCQAVQHAHQKGIIHRDIKPTNVMVTLHDGKPVPKVIDFGIAKAVNRQLTEKTLFTHYAQIIGTPTYMSPEQAEMSGLDIDIRTDVFSLGTLLYELLTGGPPFDSLYLLNKSYEEMQRIIREEEPTQPSTKISTLGEALIDVAKHRRTSPDILRRLIRADLDWIVMKTLEKDRNRRYDSVGEFAADIRRYLNNEPVLAGPPSVLYRVKKLIQRRRILVTATTTVAAALIIGLVVSISLYLRMRQALNTVSQLEEKVEVDSKLSTAERLYAEGRYQAALNEIEAMLDVQDLGPKAHLLRAQLLVEVGRSRDAETQLLPLTQVEPEIAGAAYYLLARINMGINDAKADEYEALAASMLPETAEAYSLRAMTSSSPEAALQWLDRAIALDPSHWPSRKARVLIHYTLGKDQEMVEDVAALIALRPADSLGYAIRAIMRRDSGRFEEAVADHNRAIELCEGQAELIEVYDQRYETYTKMGNHSAALKDAKCLVELNPQDFRYRYYVFTSLITLRDFAAAQQEYRAIVQTSYQWDRNIRRYIAYYVFNVLDAGQTLVLPPDIVKKAPFAEMMRAADCYHALVSKATRLALPRQGVVPYAWSPDGKQLLCGSWGIYRALRPTISSAIPTVRNVGLKIIDIESGKERLVAEAIGGIPAWSPDGKYIAYPDQDRNLCIVPAEGGQPRKLASGFWTQWSKDSQRLYYNTSFGWGDLSYIDINIPDAIPHRLIRSPGSFVICEAEQWVAFGRSMGIDILSLSSGSILYQYTSVWPQDGWVLSLSPNGRELAFTSWYPRVYVGPFILDTQYKRLYRVLAHPVDRLVWSPDGSKLAIGAKRDIWIMDVDPNLTVCETLGQLSSQEDLIAGEIERKSQAITADPLYPERYLRRALAYMSLHQFDKAEFDLQQFDSLVTSDDHHVGYEMFWWLKQCYGNELYEEAEILTPHAEDLIKRFPADVPSYRDLIADIVKQIDSGSKTELAARWRAKLQELE